MRKICTLITSKATDIDENIANQNHATRTRTPKPEYLNLSNFLHAPSVMRPAERKNSKFFETFHKTFQELFIAVRLCIIYDYLYDWKAFYSRDGTHGSN